MSLCLNVMANTWLTLMGSTPSSLVPMPFARFEVDSSSSGLCWLVSARPLSHCPAAATSGLALSTCSFEAFVLLVLLFMSGRGSFLSKLLLTFQFLLAYLYSSTSFCSFLVSVLLISITTRFILERNNLLTCATAEWSTFFVLCSSPPHYFAHSTTNWGRINA